MQSNPIRRTVHAMLAAALLPWSLPACLAQQPGSSDTNPPEQATPAPAEQPFDIQWAPALIYLRSYSDPSTAPQFSIENTPIQANTFLVYEYHIPWDLREGPHTYDTPEALERLRNHIRTYVEQAIPDPNFNGYGVIDWESWYPLWVPALHRPTTYPEIWPRWMDHMRANRPTEVAGLRGSDLEAKYRETYNASAKAILLTMLDAAKRARPLAKWGYYAFPGPVLSGYGTTNPAQAFWMERNNELAWLYEAQDAIFPSLYIQKKSFPDNVQLSRNTQFHESQNRGFIETNMAESHRIAGGKPILPFVWMRYHGTNPEYGYQMISDFDLQISFEYPKNLGATGIIVWEEVHTIPEFNMIRNYMNQKLIPLARRIGDPSAWTPTLLQQSPSPGSTEPAPAMLRSTRVETGSSPNPTSANPPSAGAQPATRSFRRELRAERHSSAGNPSAAEIRAAIRRANRR